MQSEFRCSGSLAAPCKGLTWGKGEASHCSCPSARQERQGNLGAFQGKFLSKVRAQLPHGKASLLRWEVPSLGSTWGKEGEFGNHQAAGDPLKDGQSGR